MVSLPQMYSQRHGSNLPYPGLPAWYSPAYASHHMPPHPNNQFLNGTPGIGVPNGMLESDSAAAYAAHQHMLHQTSPEWSHDNYGNLTPNPQLFPNNMSSSSSLHISPTLNNHHSGNGNNNSGSADNLSNTLQNVPPSPPITVNSNCSEMSSPGIGSNGMITIGNGEGSPNMSNSNDLSRPKSPYDWMKKPSYQSQPNPGLNCFYFISIYSHKSVY